MCKDCTAVGTSSFGCALYLKLALRCSFTLEINDHECLGDEASAGSRFHVEQYGGSGEEQDKVIGVHGIFCSIPGPHGDSVEHEERGEAVHQGGDEYPAQEKGSTRRDDTTKETQLGRRDCLSM